MRVHRATAHHLPAILRLEESFEERDRWTGPMWAAELGWPDRHVGIIPEGDQIVAVATFQELGDVVDLHRIVVSPPRRREGLGTLLLEDGISWSRCKGAERILLEVRHDNHSAIGFYRRHGFTDVAERRDYYGPDRHALVLGLDLREQAT